MIYPSTIQYLEALQQRGRNFKTKSLASVVLCTDYNGDEIYSSSSNSVSFEVQIKGKRKLLRLFLNQNANDNYILKEGSKRYEKELLVATTNSMGRFDIIVEEAQAPTQKASTLHLLEVREDRAAYTENNKWGFKNRKNETIIDAKYDKVELFFEGRAVVCIDDKYGVIDNSGNEIIPLIFDDLSYDNSYYCNVEIEGKCGIINRLGEIVIPLEWEWVGEFSQERVLVSRDGLFGFYDNLGNAITEIIYNDATSFNDQEFAKVRVGEREFLINKNGKRIS